MKDIQKYIIVARVNNRPGVVSRISGLFTRRGYNIENLITGTTESDKIYHMTVTMYSTKEEVDLLVRQLERITDVIEVYIGDSNGGGNLITSELMFICVKCTPDKRESISAAAKQIDCRIAGIREDAVIVEVTGNDARLESAIAEFAELGEIEIIRSGTMAVSGTLEA
jgi:acetolactate synthase, small subunit